MGILAFSSAAFDTQPGAPYVPVADVISPVKPARWSTDALLRAADVDSELPALHGAFLRNVERFDPQPFGLTPAEALAADPQQRLLLTLAAECFARGRGAGRARGGAAQGASCGVFIGISWTEYARLCEAHGSAAASGPYAAQGAVLSVAAGRLSFTFGLSGGA